MAKHCLTLISLLCCASLPAFAQEEDCLTGNVTFQTGAETRVLTLYVHERPIEVPKGLFRMTELPPHGGVFAVYPAPRNNRKLANSDVMAADLMSFDDDGQTLNILRDETGPDVDYMRSGDGMSFAAYLAGGTVADMGFDTSTQLVDFVCTDWK